MSAGTPLGKTRAEALRDVRLALDRAGYRLPDHRHATVLDDEETEAIALLLMTGFTKLAQSMRIVADTPRAALEQTGRLIQEAPTLLEAIDSATGREQFERLPQPQDNGR